MHVLELLAPLQSYAVSKVRKLTGFLWRITKHVIKHPIKTLFTLFKLWLCLMVLSVFATLAIAQDYNPEDLRSPSQVPAGDCFSNYSGWAPSPPYSFESCKSYVHGSIPRMGVSFSRMSGLNMVFFYTDEATGEQKETGGGRFLQNDTTLGCPPEGAPKHTIPVGSGDNLMCAKPYVENECPEPTINDGYVFGTAVSPERVCYDNPDSDTQCSISTDDTGGYYLPSVYGSQEPVNCNTAPPSGSDDSTDDPEDQFCYVYGSNGIFSADCPTTSIAFDITGIQKNADQLVVNHERFQDIENSMISQSQIDQLLESGELKGEKGDTGEKGERGLMGLQGIQGIQGVAGVAGKNGIDGQDGVDGQNGQDGKDGINGTNGIDGRNGVDGADGRDGKDGINGTNGVDGTDGIDGEDGEDGENCSVVNTSNGAVISCPDGSSSEVEGIDTDAVVSELVKQTNEIKKQTDEITKLGTYDGDAPKIDYTTRPEKFNEISNFDWENNNFGTVLEEHNDAMRNLPLFAAIDDFFVTSFGGTCPVWTETISVLGASIPITIDQFCSSAVQSTLPAVRAILLLVAGFFAWRIAIE